MLGICYRYTKSVEDAEDVLQQAFVKVFTNLPRYREEGELGAWIRRIMVNTALNYLKQNKRYSSELSYDEDKLHPVSAENPSNYFTGKRIGRSNKAVTYRLPNHF